MKVMVFLALIGSKALIGVVGRALKNQHIGLALIASFKRQ